MRIRPGLDRRSRTALSGLFGAFSLLVCTALLAQTSAKPDQGPTEQPHTAPPVEHAQMPPPPANPLVRSSAAGSGPVHTLSQRRPLHHFGDFQSEPVDDRILKAPQDLPIFGYDFFAPARQFIKLQSVLAATEYQDMVERSRLGLNPVNAGSLGFIPGLGAAGQPGSPSTLPGAPGATGAPGIPGGSSGLSANTGGGSGAPLVGGPAGQSGLGAAVSGIGAGAALAAGAGGTSTQAQLDAAAQSLREQNAQRALLGLPPLAPIGGGSAPYPELPSYTPLPQFPSFAAGQNGNFGTQYGNQAYGTAEYYGAQSYGSGFAPGPRPADAYSEVTGPYQQMVRNVAASVPSTYQLSGGDTLVIRYSNPAMAPRTLEPVLDSQGNVMLGEAGSVNLAGLTLGHAEQVVRRRLLRYYKNVDVTITLKGLRTISVMVAGKAYQPGTYTVPAVATAFNVLYAAGGPTEDGSLRSIEVHRGQKVLTLDFYKMLVGAAANEGGKSFQPDIPLQAGDVIVIPGIYSRVAVTGDVRYPAQYELKPAETLKDALGFAGGPKASGGIVQVDTLDPANSHIIKTIDLRSPAALTACSLYDGDVVDVLSLRPTITNMVSVQGAVGQPSEYALTPGMRVSDLVRDARNPISEAYLGRAALYRWDSDGTTTLIPIDLQKALDGDPASNVELKRWDRLVVYTRAEAAFAGVQKIVVAGAVQRPGTYEYSRDMRLSDLMYKVGGPLPDAQTVVVEHQYGDGTKRYEQMNVADLVHGGRDLDLLDNDRVAVYTNNEAAFTPDHSVTIKGYVTAQGTYDRGEGMRLTDLIHYAGGFRPDASDTVTVTHARRFTDGAHEPATVAVKFDSQHECAPQDDLLLEDGDVVTVDGRGSFQDTPLIVTIEGQVNRPGPYPITQTTRLSDLVKMAGGLRGDAFPQGAQLLRDPAKMTSPQQQELARVISDLSDLYNQSEYKRQLAASDLERIRQAGQAESSSTPIGLPNSPQAPNAAAATLAQQLSQHQLVSEPRTLSTKDLTPSGNIAIDLPDAIRKPGGSDDILLVDRDAVTVPETPTTVQVIGAVVNQRGVEYVPGANLAYYINAAGGFAPDVARDHIVVIHAGGGLTPVNKIRSLQPGDLIFVPTRVMAEKLGGKSNSISDFFKSLTTSAIVFRLATGIFGL